MSEPRVVSFVVRRDFDSLASLLTQVGDWCESGGIADNDQRRLLIVLDECLSNVIRHGSGIDVHVRLRQGVRFLYVLIVDKAPPFSPQLRPSHHSEEGGRGLLLVDSLTARCHHRCLRLGNGLLLTHCLSV